MRSTTHEPVPSSPSPAATPRSRRRRVVVVVGAVCVALGLVAVVARDIARIDPTSGGYEAPYEDFTGEPIDWSAHSTTATGFRDTGGVIVDTSLDCTSGMIRAHVGPFTFDIRPLSARAIAVHRPQVACLERGFEPEWSYPAEDAR